MSADRTTISLPKGESDRITKDVAAEYQRLVDACNRITDRDIDDYFLRKAFERRAAKGGET